jgi:hypothetical protein
MTLETSLDLVQDILDRADELTDGSSDFQDQALRFLNRAYRALCMGGNEFMPGRNPDWWWLRDVGTLLLRPAYTTGTMDVSNESTGVAISTPPSAYALQGWHLKFDGNDDVYYMESHVIGEFAGTLDSPYTGTTATVSFTAMPLEYQLATDVLRLLDPMKSDRDNGKRITGMGLDVLEDTFPLGQVGQGFPTRFAPMSETRVRFNAYPSELMKVRYPYVKRAADLENLDVSVPLVPLQFRYILSDMALYYLMQQKEDTRKDEIAALAKAGITAMESENRGRMNRIGEVGQIFPRPQLRNPGILRTESGHIIG